MKKLPLLMVLLVCMLPFVAATVITNIDTTISTSSATVTWETDQITDDNTVFYGTSSSSLTQSASESGQSTTTHSVTLNGLQAGKQYFYEIESRGVAGTARTPTRSFVTTVAKVTGLKVEGKSTTSVDLSWTSVTGADKYNVYQDGVNVKTVTGTSTTISGLSEGTTYRFKVSAERANEEGAQSAEVTVTTDSTGSSSSTGGGPSGPTISNLQITSVSTTSATVTWTTSQSATTKVEYGLNPSLTTSQTRTVSGSRTSHSVILIGLTSGTTYHYKAVSSGVESSIQSFTTQSSSSSTGGSTGGGPDPTNTTNDTTIGPATDSFLTVEALPAKTRKTRLNVSGSTRQNARLYIFVNSEVAAQTRVTVSGTSFKEEIRLNPRANEDGIDGGNKIQIYSWDEDGKRDVKEFFVVVDNEPPLLRVANIPSITRDNTVNVTGETDPGQEVEFFLDSSSQGKVTANAEGNFTKQMNLGGKEQNYTIRIVARDEVGNEAEITQSILVDTKSPMIKITNVPSGSVHYKIYMLRGETEPGAKVSVENFGEFNGCDDPRLRSEYTSCEAYLTYQRAEQRAASIDPAAALVNEFASDVTAGSDGTFKVPVALIGDFEGNRRNRIVVSARDRAGNIATKEIEINYEPGCPEWTVGQIETAPVNIYTQDLKAGNLQTSAFVELKYNGPGTPRISGAPRITLDSESGKGSLFNSGSSAGQRMVSVGPTRATPYNQLEGSVYVYVPITFQKYTGSHRKLPGTAQIYLEGNLRYELLDFPDEHKPSSCGFYFVAGYDIQKPTDTLRFFSEDDLNDTAEFFGDLADGLEDTSDFVSDVNIATTLSCAGMIAANYLGNALGGVFGGTPGTDMCSDTGLFSLENTYYVCDRVLCPSAPPKCEAFSPYGDGFDAGVFTNNAQRLQDQVAAYRQSGIEGFENWQDNAGAGAVGAPEGFPNAYQGTITDPVTKNELDVYYEYFSVDGSDRRSWSQELKEAIGTKPLDCPASDVPLSSTQTVIRITKVEKGDGFGLPVPGVSDGAGVPDSSTTSVEWRCTDIPREFMPPPDVGLIPGCYNEECPQYDNTKCFGTDGVEPSGGLISSVQCACLPAVQGYLDKYTELARAAEICFEQAAAGEASGGYCERLFTIFVCDIATEILDYMGLPGSGGGFSSLVGGSREGYSNAAEKSEQLTKNLKGRYGSIVNERMGLSSDQIVNKACIAAFSGDFSVLEEFIQQSVARPDIPPGGYVEGDARVYGLDPFSGTLTIAYNIYVGLQPGGPDTIVDAYLECDPNYEGNQYCLGSSVGSTQAGLPVSSNQYSLTRQPVSPRNVPALLNERSRLFNENLLLIQENSRTVFNKIVLKMTYTLNGVQQEKVIEQPIRLQGDIPSQCTFQIPAGITCQLDRDYLNQAGSVILHGPSGASQHRSQMLPQNNWPFFQGNAIAALIPIENNYLEDFNLRVDIEGGKKYDYPISSVTSQSGEEVASEFTALRYYYALIEDVIGADGDSAEGSSVQRSLEAWNHNDPGQSKIEIPNGFIEVDLPTGVESVEMNFWVQSSSASSGLGNNQRRLRCVVNPSDSEDGLFVYATGTSALTSISQESDWTNLCAQYQGEPASRNRLSPEAEALCGSYTPSEFSRVDGNTYYCMKPIDSFKFTSTTKVNAMDITEIRKITFGRLVFDSAPPTGNKLTFTVNGKNIDVEYRDTGVTNLQTNRRRVSFDVIKQDSLTNQFQPILSPQAQTQLFQLDYNVVTQPATGLNKPGIFLVEPNPGFDKFNNDGKEVPVGFIVADDTGIKHVNLIISDPNSNNKCQWKIEASGAASTTTGSCGGLTKTARHDVLREYGFYEYTVNLDSFKGDTIVDITVAAFDSGGTGSTTPTAEKTDTSTRRYTGFYEKVYDTYPDTLQQNDVIVCIAGSQTPCSLTAGRPQQTQANQQVFANPSEVIGGRSGNPLPYSTNPYPDPSTPFDPRLGVGGNHLPVGTGYNQ